MTMGIMTAQESVSRRGTDQPAATAWLVEWFSAHGLAGVPVNDNDGPTLTLAVTAEFDSWCEARGISPHQQDHARALAGRRLPAAPSLPRSVRAAAVDVAAWHDLRVGLAQLAS